LRGMLPSWLAALAHLQRIRILLDIHGRDIVVARQIGDEYTEFGRVGSDAREHQGVRSALNSALRRMHHTRIDTVVRLPAAQALRRRIPLPLSAARSLRQVLAHEFDRQMPLSRDQAYYDCRVLTRDKEKKQITAELIAVKRAVLDRALDLTSAWGLRLSGVELIEEGGPARLPGLLQPSGPTPRSRWEWRSTAGLAGLAMVLGVGTIAALVDRQQTFADALAQQLADAKSQAQGVQQLQKKVDAVAESQRFLPQQKRASSAITVLNEVTRILPDGAWLFDLELRGREARLHGFAPAASSLLGLFAQSPLFENARFRAPLTQGPQGGLERFDLSLDFKGSP